MDGWFTRAARIFPFVLLGGAACFLCIIAMLDRLDSPYLFGQEGVWLFYAVLALPLVAAFELKDEQDFFGGVVSSTTLGILATSLILFVGQGMAVNFDSLMFTAGMVLFGMIPWIMCCMLYFVFFALGCALRALHRWFWNHKKAA